MMDKEDPIWGAVIAADGQYGDEAELQARRTAALAAEAAAAAFTACESMMSVIATLLLGVGGLIGSF